MVSRHIAKFYDQNDHNSNIWCLLLWEFHSRLPIHAYVELLEQLLVRNLDCRFAFLQCSWFSLGLFAHLQQLVPKKNQIKQLIFRVYSEDLKSEAIWYIFGPFTKYGKYGSKGSFKAFYRTHFFIWICENCRNSLSHFFRKNFVKSMVLLKKSLNSWFDEIFYQWERISRFSTLWIPQCGNGRNSLSLKKNFVKSTI